MRESPERGAGNADTAACSLHRHDHGLLYFVWNFAGRLYGGSVRRHPWETTQYSGCHYGGNQHKENTLYQTGASRGAGHPADNRKGKTVSPAVYGVLYAVCTGRFAGGYDGEFFYGAGPCGRVFIYPTLVHQADGTYL